MKKHGANKGINILTCIVAFSLFCLISVPAIATQSANLESETIVQSLEKREAQLAEQEVASSSDPAPSSEQAPAAPAEEKKEVSLNPAEKLSAAVEGESQAVASRVTGADITTSSDESGVQDEKAAARKAVSEDAFEISAQAVYYEPGSDDPAYEFLKSVKRGDVVLTNEDKVSPGDVLTYVITFENKGEKECTNVKFTDRLKDTPLNELVAAGKVTNLGITSKNGNEVKLSFNTDSKEYVIDTLPAGDVVTVSYDYTVLQEDRKENPEDSILKNVATSYGKDEETENPVGDPEYGSITIVKKISGDFFTTVNTETGQVHPADRTVIFNVVGYKLDGNGAQTDEVVYRNQVGINVGITTGTSQERKLDNLPVDAVYTITEVDYGLDGYAFASCDPADGKIKLLKSDNAQSITFINESNGVESPSDGVVNEGIIEGTLVKLAKIFG